MAMRRTRSGHLTGMQGSAEEPEIEEIEAPPWALDGNSVSLEREMVRLKSTHFSILLLHVGYRKDCRCFDMWLMERDSARACLVC